ncbi:MAG TPA: hypothetical protein VGO57_04505 [Verrucomicrobiae bacterium]|jgi:hypothetical protein
MNLPELQEKLIAAARANNPPSDHVPYAFEKRITALIQARSVRAGMDAWVQGLWRAALSCVVIAVACGAWAFFAPDTTATTSEDLSQNFDTTLLASVDQSDFSQ